MKTTLKHVMAAAVLGACVLARGWAEDRPKAVCGNGKIEVGETCDDGNTKDGDSCPANCRIEACKEMPGPGRKYVVFLEGAANVELQGVNVFVRYPEAKVGIPSGGSDEVVKRNILDLPADALAVPNDLDYGLREVIVSTKALPIGKLFTIQFYDCERAPGPPERGEFTCALDDTSDATGNRVSGFSCSIRPV